MEHIERISERELKLNYYFFIWIFPVDIDTIVIVFLAHINGTLSHIFKLSWIVCYQTDVTSIISGSTNTENGFQIGIYLLQVAEAFEITLKI